MGSQETGYQLGSDAAELKRLDLQGRVLAPATRTIPQTAGIRPVCGFSTWVQERGM